ncbi:hypothetical protein [Nocardia brasiliensis]|uniref:hypothetical protein n=1 Tax=Nocardia brasiliensis TaxID=37326 RepID=UPI002454ABE0|nr:hypothetical protein [Nocardia brasiliensis]
MSVVRTATSIAIPFAFVAMIFTPAANAEVARTSEVVANNKNTRITNSTMVIPTRVAKKGKVEDAIRCLEENGVPKGIASAAAGACLVYPLPAKVVPCFVAFGIASGMAERCGG